MLETFAERKSFLMSNERNELSLAIEGRFTNLRIWVGRIKAPIDPDNSMGVYMRLDKAQNYSAPLNQESFNYLEGDHEDIWQLLQFGFPAPIENLDEILRITIRRRYRQLTN